MQQEKQAQQLQQLNAGAQAAGNLLQPNNSSLTSLQHNEGALQQSIGGGTNIQPSVVSTSQPIGVALPSSSTGSLGQSGLTSLQTNGVRFLPAGPFLVCSASIGCGEWCNSVWYALYI